MDTNERQLRISSTYLRRLVREHSDPRGILQQLGLEDRHRDDADTVALTDLVKLIRAIDASAKHGWHLKFARRTADHFHGPLTFALMSAPTIGDGLRAFADYAQIRAAYLRGKITRAGAKCVIELAEVFDLGDVRHILLEIAFLILHDYVATIGDVNLAAATLSLNYPASSKRHYHAVGFNCPVIFSQPHNSLTIPAVWAAIPNPQYDETTWMNAIVQCNKALAEMDTSDVSAHTRAYITATLAQRPEQLSIDHAARDLGLSVRTLIRRLRENGTNFQTLRDSARQELALQLLSKPSMTIEQVGLALGFSDAANFTRAFKRWFGVPPGKYRREQL